MNTAVAVTVILGMYRSIEENEERPFDFSELTGYRTICLPQIQEAEKTYSTLFYETLQGLDQARKTLNINKESFVLILGRSSSEYISEKYLFNVLKQTMEHYGHDLNHIIIAKSYGVASTLLALKRFYWPHKKPNIQAFILIDGFTPLSKRKKIAVQYKNIDINKWRFVIPPYVKLCRNIVQRSRSSQGYLINQKYNYIIKQEYVNQFATTYNRYCDGFKKTLKISHFNIDEIISVVPCIKLNNNMETLSTFIEKFIKELYCKGNT